MIPFNKPFLTGNEIQYIIETFNYGKISGNGHFTKKCQDLFQQKYGFKKCLLTTSCTDALEMCAILINVQPGDEIIIPSYTFVSTANAFILRGAKIIFADSCNENPNIDINKIENLINGNTKAIVIVHYGGIANDMDKIIEIAKRHNLFVIEDAAQAIDSYYNKRALGSIGHLSTFSFHETKNINSGEGGMLVINDERFINRSEIIWEKGTNRAEFFRGEINKYGWVDIGSSFLPSDITAAFLFAQIENIDKIQSKRKDIWNLYYERLIGLQNKGLIKLPYIPEYATNNAHVFYILCKNISKREELLEYLKQNGILAVFHYQSLHKSEFYKNKHDGRELSFSDMYSDCLIRLPLYYELEGEQVEYICNKIIQFFETK